MSENGNGHAPPDPTQGTTERPPPSLGEQLGLGHVWNPAGPVVCSWRKLNAPEGVRHLLTFHTAAGVFGFTMSPDDLRGFIAEALKQSSGLVLPP